MTDKMFRCKRCGYSTETKCNLISHLNRKYKCECIHENIDRICLLDELKRTYPDNTKCRYCNKDFSFKTSMYRHMKTCKLNTENQGASSSQAQAQAPGSESGSVTINNITNNTNNTNNIDNSTTNIDNSVHIHNHNHIIVAPFGTEDLDFLFEGKYRSIMRKCVAEPMKGVQHIIKLVHFNTEKPEYQNVCIPNVSRPHALIYDGTLWILNDREEIVKKLINTSASSMYAFVDENKNLPARVLRVFDEFDIKRDEEDPEMMAQLIKEAERTIMNNQDEMGVRAKARQERRNRFAQSQSQIGNQ